MVCIFSDPGPEYIPQKKLGVRPLFLQPSTCPHSTWCENAMSQYLRPQWLVTLHNEYWTTLIYSMPLSKRPRETEVGVLNEPLREFRRGGRGWGRDSETGDLGLGARESAYKNRMASFEVNVKVLHLHLKHQQHKARQGKYGRNTKIGETQSNRISVIKDLLINLLRRH